MCGFQVKLLIRQHVTDGHVEADSKSL